MRSPYAGVVSRAVGYVVDALVVGGLALAGLAVVELLGAVTGVRTRHVAPVPAGAGLPVLFAGYQTAFWGLAGRTPGMALVGVRVTTTRGTRPSWPTAAVRALVLTAFPLGFLWSVVDRRHQAVHDKLARTLVIRA